MSAGVNDTFTNGAGARSWWPLPLLALLIVVASGSFGLASLWPGLHGAWINAYGAFSHGYLVLALCGLLVIKYCRASKFLNIAPWWPGTILLAGFVAVLCLMDFMFINSARLALLPLLALSTIALVFGLQTARVLFLPTIFLYLALPVWWLINEPLQHLTVMVAGFLVKVMRLPAYLEGNFVHVPAGTFEIASGCSGLNYLIAALSLSGFQALAYLGMWKNRLLLLLASAVAALVANWLRVYSLIVIGIATDMQHYLIRVEHLYYGWALFMTSMVPVFVLARRLDARENSTVPVLASRQAPIIVGSLIPAAVVAGLLLLLPRLGGMSPPGPLPSQTSAPLPTIIGDWIQETSQTAWIPQFPHAEISRAAYIAGTRRVEAYRASYGWQTADARAVSPESGFTGPGWQVIEFADRALEADAGRSLAVQEYRGHLDGREYILWGWYEVAGRSASSKLGAKLLELRGLLMQRRDAAALALMAECVPDCAAARTSLAEIARSGIANLR